MTGTFRGFTPETIEFLKDLRMNNDKAWFELHRKRYENALLQPMTELVSELGEFMTDKIDPFLMTTPPNKIISRIHRDTRFSKDKSPFKTTVWLTFKRPSEAWQSDPGFFFEIGPDLYRYGMGFFSASKETMDRWRALIDAKPKAFTEIIAFVDKSSFLIEGEVYKKPMGTGHPDIIQPWYGRKNLYLVRNCPINGRLFDPGLAGTLQDGFELLAPIYHLMWRAKLGG